MSAVQAQFHKDDIVTVVIEDLGASGEGIGHADGFTLFIKDALPGDTVRAKIMKVKKGYGFARLVEIAEPSPFRVAARCPAARPCGGCQVQELAYEKQLEFKQRKVRENLIRIGGFEASFADAVLRPVLGMEDPWRFRNKAQYPVGERVLRTEACPHASASLTHGANEERRAEAFSTENAPSGSSHSAPNGHRGNVKERTAGTAEPAAGFYAGRTHHIVPVEDCLIGAPENAPIVRAVLDYMKRYHVSAYDEKTGKGLVRHILIRNGYYSGEILVCLVVNGTKLPKEERLIPALREAAPEIAGISLNVNTEKTNVIMGRQVRTLWGKDAMEDSLRVLDVLPGKDPDDDGGAAEGEAAETDSFAGQGEISNIPMNEGHAMTVRFRPAGRSVTFRISPLSFYQVNPRQTEKLYSLVRYFAGLTGREIVWDLYCGVGTISCFLARDAGEVYGVEVIPDAIRDARENARCNGLTNVTFEVGKAEEVLPAYVKRVKEERRAVGASGVNLHDYEIDCGTSDGGPCGDQDGTSCEAACDVVSKAICGVVNENVVDVVVVDPPRKGCDIACLRAILEAAPRRIVYVSCDPATLARDLRILTDGGYEIRAVQPVDMFPHSIHIETVCLLGNRIIW